MFQPDWLILHILHPSFEIERTKGHYSEVVVHLYMPDLCIFTYFHNNNSKYEILDELYVLPSYLAQA